MQGGGIGGFDFDDEGLLSFNKTLLFDHGKQVNSIKIYLILLYGEIVAA